MTLKLEGDLDIPKMYLHTKNKFARLRHSKLKPDEIWIGITSEMKKYEYKLLMSKVKVNVTNFNHF